MKLGTLQCSVLSTQGGPSLLHRLLWDLALRLCGHLHELGCLVGVCCQIVDGETQGACCGFVSSLHHAAHISKSNDQVVI